jgi:hypothetical protein
MHDGTNQAVGRSRMGQCDFRVVPGDHESLFTNPAHRLALAQELKACLQMLKAARNQRPAIFDH